MQSNKRNISFSPPDISELEINEVAEALRSGWITTGPRTKLLERRLMAYIETGRTDIDCNTAEAKEKYSNRVVCLNSATAAEELNLRILGIRPGDEVIVPAYTYTATASAAVHCGATVKFIDIQKDGDVTTHAPEMDYEALEKAITPSTKAVILVDLGGIVCDYDRVFRIVEEKKNIYTPLSDHSDTLNSLSSHIQSGLGRVAVVADAAHALGASRNVEHISDIKKSEKDDRSSIKRYVGSIADFTSFSFHAVKNFTTAEGGASTWNLPKSVYDTGVTDADIYHMYQLLSLHGQDKDALAKTKIGAWEYDIIGPWYKCNMTDVMAAIGLRQLDRYLGLLDRRTEIIRRYDETCDKLGISHLVHHTGYMDSSNHLYLMRIPGITEEQRNELITKMAEQGVATNVHYKPLPMMTAYRKLGWKIEDFPNTYDYYHNLVTLPLHTLLSDEDLEYICDVLEETIRNN
ncbi:MAG: DegT/DnrJ/EryC1/StrS family aminotransferase [Lachnospiraceae bacterium]|nr:DegT/DnrJ/EryC1/StrS family aminotransferase [Lachnospiraceae bacterium]